MFSSTPTSGSNFRRPIELLTSHQPGCRHTQTELAAIMSSGSAEEANEGEIGASQAKFAFAQESVS